MKAIIIAAGMGVRLAPLTNNKPKCMLELNGKTLLEHQIEALKGAGIERIALVKGYKQEMINYPGLTYYINDNYQDNNILHSLFYAEKEMADDFIAVYSDIIYSKDIVSRILENKADISAVVDLDWQASYKGRTDHPPEEAEKVIFDADNNLVKIGKILPDKNQAQAEFIGMIKCTVRGAGIFREHFNNLKDKYRGKPFQTASVFEKAYITDILQDLVDSGIYPRCVPVNGGWKEIDTIGDYQRLIDDNKN
jgi:choline kinase